MNDSDLLQQIAGEAAQPAPAGGRRLGGGAIVLLTGLIAVIAVIGFALARQNQGQPTSGAAPDFTVTTFDGGTFRLSDQRGKVVVLNFWASWCAPCHAEAPALQRLSERYAGRVVFIGVTHVDEPRDSLDFIRRYGITYPNAEDPRGDITKRLYRITGVPETFVIDQDGQIAHFSFSAVKEAEMIPLLERLLGGTA